jgi:hypothetical protein
VGHKVQRRVTILLCEFSCDPPYCEVLIHY